MSPREKATLVQNSHCTKFSTRAKVTLRAKESPCRSDPSSLENVGLFDYAYLN